LIARHQRRGLAADPFDVPRGDDAQAGPGVPGLAAGKGWDAVTGLGIPANARTLAHALVGW
jgi:hypothetical protein